MSKQLVDLERFEEEAEKVAAVAGVAKFADFFVMCASLKAEVMEYRSNGFPDEEDYSDLEDNDGSEEE